MRYYETMHLVKGEDLNHHGTLFAAKAAAWFVEAGFAAAACEHGNTDEIVLRILHNMSFRSPVEQGTVIRFRSRVVSAGSTSITVCIWAVNALDQIMALDGYITFVTIDKETGRKKAHNVTLDDIADEEEASQRAQALMLRSR